MSVLPGTHLDDVSEFQSMNWNAYAKVRNAAIIRVDYGTSHPDQQWVQNHPARTASGLLVVCGLYCYLTDFQDPAAEANAFCDMVGSLSPGEFVALDYEESTGANDTARAQQFFAVTDKRLGLRGTRRPFWEAGYGAEPRALHDLWQHTDGDLANHECQPAYPGAPACDCSVFPGTITQLRALVDECNSWFYSYGPFVDAHINLAAIQPSGSSPAPAPTSPTTKVTPMYSPAFSIPAVVASMDNPAGKGAYTLQADGSVDNWGSAPICRGVNGQAFFAGRTPANLAPPTPAEAAAHKLLAVISTSGERYACPPTP